MSFSQARLRPKKVHWTVFGLDWIRPKKSTGLFCFCEPLYDSPLRRGADVYIFPKFLFCVYAEGQAEIYIEVRAKLWEVTEKLWEVWTQALRRRDKALRGFTFVVPVRKLSTRRKLWEDREKLSEVWTQSLRGRPKPLYRIRGGVVVVILTSEATGWGQSLFLCSKI